MQIESKDQDKFKRLGIQSISALATIAPTAYEDKRITTQMQVDKMQVIDATVEQISRSPKRTLITLFAHNFNHRIDAVLFNPKPYLLHHFVIGEQSFFYGKISCSSGHCQMTHPLKIGEVGTIVPKYKTALRADVMRRLVERYINSDNLRAEGLPDAVIKILLSIHFPTPEQGDRLSLHQIQALKFTELYDYMKVLGNKRRYFPSLYQLTGKWNEWSATLPFTLTTEQTAAIEAIENDLKKDVSAKRMVVGDVGSGKTMVILASALMAQPHRAILMAPTTILANQLFEEAQKHLPHLKSVLVQNSTKKSLDLTQYDFIIGTHALLYRELPESGLIMIDEQHRFGTAQRKLLENLLTTG
ncbi:MAG: DEAD/DEAH box helicase, partial [Sulfurimonadaceae bacterium]